MTVEGNEGFLLTAPPRNHPKRRSGGHQVTSALTPSSLPVTEWPQVSPLPPAPRSPHPLSGDDDTGGVVPPTSWGI